MACDEPPGDNTLPTLDAGPQGTGAIGGGGAVATGGAGADGGTGGAGDAGTPLPMSEVGCDDATRLLPLPDDPGERGPWKVGVRTVQVGRLTVEVVYPAQPGSTEGLPEAFYDVRQWLPEAERSKISDAESPDVEPLGGELYRDVPIDADHGPYPVIVHIHGTSSFRIASGSSLAHWASHGFIAIAADHPGLWLQDQLAPGCGLPQSGLQDLFADVQAELDALKSASGDLAFVGDRADTTRIAVNGHSQGGCTVAALAALPGVRVAMPFSGSVAVPPGPDLESVLFVGGENDTVITFPRGGLPGVGNWVCPGALVNTSAGAYDISAGPPVTRRLVGIRNGGHLSTTDLCQTNDFGDTALELAIDNMVCGVATAAVIGLPALFDCGPAGMETPHSESLPPINYVSTAVLEETMFCRDRSAAFAQFQTLYPVVGTFEQSP